MINWHYYPGLLGAEEGGRRKNWPDPVIGNRNINNPLDRCHRDNRRSQEMSRETSMGLQLVIIGWHNWTYSFPTHTRQLIRTCHQQIDAKVIKSFLCVDALQKN